MSRPLVFIGYSHKDEKEKDWLLSHLAVLQQAGLVELWSDDQIEAGADWQMVLYHTILQAKLAIIIISANFLTSKFISDEMIPLLLQRHKREELVIFSVIAKACAWQLVDWMAEVNIRPGDGRPVWGNSSQHADEQLADIAREIASIVTNEANDFLNVEANPLIKQYKEERHLDAAIPKQVEVGKVTELLVMIRLQNSEGLSGLLKDNVEFQAQPQDVQSKPFDVEFPVDARRSVKFAELWIRIETTDFVLPEKRKKIRVEPLKDTELCIFLLTPKRRGILKLLVQVFEVETDLLLATGFLKINGRARVDEGVQAIRTLVTLSLGVFGVSTTSPSETANEGDDFTDKIAAFEQAPIPVKEDDDDAATLELPESPIPAFDDEEDGTVVLPPDSDQFKEDDDDDDMTFVLPPTAEEADEDDATFVLPSDSYAEEEDSTIVLLPSVDRKVDLTERLADRQLAPTAMLVCTTGPHSGQVFQLGGNIITIGRASDNNVILSGDKEISRRHSIITLESGKYIIKDQGSLNGTFVNNEIVAESHILQNGDEILVGVSTLKYQE